MSKEVKMNSIKLLRDAQAILLDLTPVALDLSFNNPLDLSKNISNPNNDESKDDKHCSLLKESMSMIKEDWNSDDDYNEVEKPWRFVFEAKQDSSFSTMDVDTDLDQTLDDGRGVSNCEEFFIYPNYPSSSYDDTNASQSSTSLYPAETDNITVDHISNDKTSQAREANQDKWKRELIEMWTDDEYLMPSPDGNCWRFDGVVKTENTSESSSLIDDEEYQSFELPNLEELEEIVPWDDLIDSIDPELDLFSQAADLSNLILDRLKEGMITVPIKVEFVKDDTNKVIMELGEFVSNLKSILEIKDDGQYQPSSSSSESMDSSTVLVGGTKDTQNGAIHLQDSLDMEKVSKDHEILLNSSSNSKESIVEGNDLDLEYSDNEQSKDNVLETPEAPESCPDELNVLETLANDCDMSESENDDCESVCEEVAKSSASDEEQEDIGDSEGVKEEKEVIPTSRKLEINCDNDNDLVSNRDSGLGGDLNKVEENNNSKSDSYFSDDELIIDLP